MKLPKIAPLMLLTLISLTAVDAQTPPTTRAATRPVRQAADGILKFLAIDADVQGQKARIEKKGANPHNIGYWTNKDDKAIWQATVENGGKFTVEVEYSLDKRAEGTEYVIELNDKSIHVKPDVTGTWMDFKTVSVGEVELTVSDAPSE